MLETALQRHLQKLANSLEAVLYPPTGDSIDHFCRSDRGRSRWIRFRDRSRACPRLTGSSAMTYKTRSSGPSLMIWCDSPGGTEDGIAWYQFGQYSIVSTGRIIGRVCE